jgi:four helix bundle protein
VSQSIKSFRDLLLWQKAIQFAKEVYELTRGFPREERFGLTSQLRRAAVSVSSNIAEGHARQGREFTHFLSVARGSLAEAESQLLLAIELEFLKSEALAPALGLCTEIRRMAASLANKLTGPRPLTPNPAYAAESSTDL